LHYLWGKKKVYKHLEEIGYVFISGQFELFISLFMGKKKKVYKHLEEIGYVFISGQFKLFISLFHIAAKNGVYITLVKEVH